MTRRHRAFASAILLGFSVAPAQAHLVSTGLGPFYDGVFQVAHNPAALLGIVALALFAGRCGAAHSRHVLIALPVGWLLACGIGINLLAVRELVTAITLLLCGALLALSVPLPRQVTTALAFGLGFGLYGMDAPQISETDPLAWSSLVGGEVAIVAVLTLLGSASSIAQRHNAAVIATRIFGSWVAAWGLLLLGWTFHAPAEKPLQRPPMHARDLPAAITPISPNRV